MTVIELIYPGLPPKEFSRNSRVHWSVIHRVQDQAVDDIGALLLESRQWPKHPLERAEIAIQFILPDRRRRDHDNLITTCKPLLDALVRLEVIKDDDLKTIGFPTYSYKYGRKGKAETRIRVEEV